MYTNFYPEHELFIESARRVFDKELRPNLKKWEEADNYPDEVYRILGRNGFLGLLISEDYGGVGGDYRLASAWCEIFGELLAVGMTVGVNMHSVVVSSALQRYGTAEAKSRWLPTAVTGEAIGAYAFTEPSVGSDLANCRTRAERRGDRWVINGSKTFITNGARANFILVLTRNDIKAGYKGFTTFVVDTKTPGFRVTKKLDKLGWRSSDTAELEFVDVEVDDSCILGNVGDGWIQAAKNLNWERLMLTLTALGGGRACLRDALRYAKDRVAFGEPIIKFDAVAQMLSEMTRKLIMTEALAHAAVDKLCSGEEARAEVSVAKRIVCEDMIWLAYRAIQIHGGYGYTTEFSAEQWWRDLRLMTIGGGTSEIMGNIVARQLGLN